jgi:hypothetical protein
MRGATRMSACSRQTVSPIIFAIKTSRSSRAGISSLSARTSGARCAFDQRLGRSESRILASKPGVAPAENSKRRILKEPDRRFLLFAGVVTIDHLGAIGADPGPVQSDCNDHAKPLQSPRANRTSAAATPRDPAAILSGRRSMVRRLAEPVSGVRRVVAGQRQTSPACRWRFF